VLLARARNHRQPAARTAVGLASCQAARGSANSRRSAPRLRLHKECHAFERRQPRQSIHSILNTQGSGAFIIAATTAKGHVRNTPSSVSNASGY
jgi:hypothetical protein